MSFLANTCADLQGSYECFCEEKEDNGSRHTFWCQQRYEVLGSKKKPLEGSMRPFEFQKKPIEKTEDNDARMAETACCSQMMFDLQKKPDSECLCECESLIDDSCAGSCKNIEIESPISGKQMTSPSFKIPNSSGRPQLKHSKSRMIQKPRVCSKYICTDSESLNSNANEDLCACEDYWDSSKLGTKELNEEQHSRSPNLNESFRSVGTGIISPRQTMDENVIPLLKSIFDVLQTIREEKLHLGPMASKNIDIHLDEPFNGLPQPPPHSAPPSSSKIPKHFPWISLDSHSSRNDDLNFESNQHFINSEDSLAISEPPERDFEQSYRKNSTLSQRLIPVDMDLLRTDDELIWEPDSNFDKPKVDDEGKTEEDVPSKAQFRQFPEEARSQLNEELKIFQVINPPIDISETSYNSGKSETTPRLSSLQEYSFMEDESSEYCAEDCPRKPNSHEKFKFGQKYENDQAVQVNLVSLQNLNSPSTQIVTTLDNQIDHLSDEKLLKTSEINKCNETPLSTVSSQKRTAKIDVGTDATNFENDNRSSIKSCNYQDSSTSQNQQMSQFIESIYFDLKAMDSCRKNNSHWQSFARLPSVSGGWQRPSRNLSYPVTIETVQELGANSLFVKWTVQDIGNIGGYEIFLDGHLTNRYFNCIHRAAVICDVNLQCPHMITLRAQPLLPQRDSLLANVSCSSNTKRSSNTTTHPAASYPQSDGSVWYPSVYHFEPNSLPAPINAVLY